MMYRLYFLRTAAKIAYCFNRYLPVEEGVNPRASELRYP